jgi:hypothetical protein
MNNSCGEKELSGQMRSLLEEQRREWALCGSNYDELHNVKIKDFHFGQTKIRVQFNPARLISTSAKVDAKSINDRPCFLCGQNRPPEQRSISCLDQYFILVNPYPIFPEHFTITHQRHSPQSILGHIDDMLALSKAIGDRYVLFYNGPRCGASAPDHMHFQAGIKGVLPIENELSTRLIGAGSAFTSKSAASLAINDGLRRYILLSGDTEASLINAFNRLYQEWQKLKRAEDEPMMNILSYYDDAQDEFQLVIFPRAKHRPLRYFAQGDEQLMLSPAAVDIGGLCITPREEDFNTITAADIQMIFDEVFETEKFLRAADMSL